MAERGSRSVFDPPSNGSSPVPAGYGSLDGRVPPERSERADDDDRERRPFRWRPGRDEESGEAPPRTPVSYARTDGAAEPGPPAPVAPPAPPARSVTPIGEKRAPAAAPAPSPAPVRPPAAPSPAPPEAVEPRRRTRVVAPAAPTRAMTAPTRAPDAPTGGVGSDRRAAPGGRAAPTGPVEPVPSAPAVPKERVDARGRIRRQRRGDAPVPEARPAAYLPETVRTRQVIRHIDVFSVLRVSVLFYLLGVIALLLAGVVLWNVAAALGTIDSIDKSIKTLFDLKTFTLHPAPVLGYGVAAGVGLIVAGSILNVLVAVVFNLLSDVTGGIAVRVVSQPDDR